MYVCHCLRMSILRRILCFLIKWDLFQIKIAYKILKIIKKKKNKENNKLINCHVFLFLKISSILKCWRLFDNWWLSDERDLARIRECAKMARERNRKGGKERRITDPGLEQRASVFRSWQLSSSTMSVTTKRCDIWFSSATTSGLVRP